MNIEFFMPARIVMGPRCIEEHSGLFGRLGSKALIVTGRHSAKLNGSEQDVRAALHKEGIPYALFDKVENNPPVQNARDAAEIARKEKVDFVIGIGGGSPLDAAKVVAILATNRLGDEDLFSGVFPCKPLPVAAVPTTAGTGSEVTQYAIMTWHAIKNKKSVASNEIIPQLAFLDAGYTETLPLNVTVNTALDALSHALEGYMSVRSTELSDLFAAESMKIIGRALHELVDAANVSRAVREKLLYASMLGGIVITHTGTTAVHALGYPLTYFLNIDHGRANGLLLHGYLEFLAADFRERVGKALNYMGCRNLNEFRDLVNALVGQKERISAEEIENFSSLSSSAGQLPLTLKVPSIDDIRLMYKQGFGH
jgi:alcohol dehydrogenase class IV